MRAVPSQLGPIGRALAGFETFEGVRSFSGGSPVECAVPIIASARSIASVMAAAFLAEETDRSIAHALKAQALDGLEMLLTLAELVVQGE